MAVGDAFNQFETLLREHLESSVLKLIVEADDPIWSFLQTVTNTRKMGRITGAGSKTAGDPGYEARWEVLFQRGGRVTGAHFGDTEATLMGPGNALVMGLGTGGQYPDPTMTPQRSYLELVSFLKKARGSIVISRDQIEAKLLGSPVEDVAAGHVEDGTYQVRALISALSWSQGDGALAQLNDAGGAVIAEANPTWIDIDAGTCHRFVKGQTYVAATTNVNKFDTPRAGVLHNPGHMHCVSVDRDNRRIALQADPGEGDITLTDDDWIIYQSMWDFTTAATGATDNTPSLSPNGVENLLINIGAFPDSDIADVTNYPELWAFIDGTYGDPGTMDLPEPEIIDEILDKMIESGSPSSTTPPMLLAEPSVWTLYNHLERRAFMVSPATGTFMSAGGVSGPVYTYGNKQFVRLNSSMCRPNTIYGLDPDSFKRFFPNDLTLRWAMSQGGVAGIGSIFRPVTSGRNLTDLSAAEFDCWWQLAQTRPNANFIRRGVESRRTYAA